jgi:hypothetical protein
MPYSGGTCPACTTCKSARRLLLVLPAGRILSTVRLRLLALLAFLASVVVADVSVFAAAPAMVSERSDHFELTAGCDAATRRRLMGHLETFYSVLEVLVPAATGVPLGEAPIRVLLFEEPSEYHAHVRRHAPGLGHNGGYYDGASRTVVSHRRANPLQLQFHEIAHAALGDVFGDPAHERYGRPGWPVWFDEGFAEYVSSFEVVPEGLKFGAPHLARIATLVSAIEAGKTLSISQLLTARPRAFTGRDMDLWYATAWGLVELLLTEPDLRRGVPKWITKLRAGHDGVLAFRDVFGGELRGLERRLYHRARRLGTQPTAVRHLAPRGKLEPWTAHDGGIWHSEAGQLVGQSQAGWSYLTTAVPLSRQYSVTVSVASSPGARFGLVLGRHAPGGYPYHSIVSFDGQEASIRRVTSPEQVTTVAARPFPVTPGEWSTVTLSVDRGILVVRVNGEDVLASRLTTVESSLFGLYVERGMTRFRDPVFGPLVRHPAGPRSTLPPGGQRHER